MVRRDRPITLASPQRFQLATTHVFEFALNELRKDCDAGASPSVFGPGDLDAGIEYQAHQALSIGLQSSSDVARKVHMSPFALRDE